MTNKDFIFKKQSNYLMFWLVITFIVLLIIIICSAFYYHPYHTANGIYEKGENYVSFVLENTKLFYIYDSEIKINKIKIDNDDIKIGDYIYLENKIYNKIMIPFVFDSNEQLVNISFKLPKTTILKKFWKGLME